VDDIFSKYDAKIDFRRHDRRALSVRTVPGTALLNSASQSLVYTPPEGENRLRELVDVIFEQPYCRIANVVDAGIAERQAASRYLKALASIEVLSERAVGKAKLFVHPRLLQLLTRESNTLEEYPA
jgi:hypothetical protein